MNLEVGRVKNLRVLDIFEQNLMVRGGGLLPLEVMLLFLFGINHFHQDWWAQSYNIDHWLKSFSSTTFLDENWNQGFRNKALSDIELLGFNTIGMHTNAPNLIDLLFKAKVPYLREYKPIVLDHYLNPKPDIYIYRYIY